ncbi:unnamed protein product, partial [Amoebophrya sp. A25]|eukprot:GSA25T00006099001.1
MRITMARCTSSSTILGASSRHGVVSAASTTRVADSATQIVFLMEHLSKVAGSSNARTVNFCLGGG